MTVELPDSVVQVLAGRPEIATWDQAVPLLTVDAAGYPHVALLSRAEVDVADDRRSLLGVVASPTTRENLTRSGTAGTTVVDGDTAYHLKLQVNRAFEAEGALAVVLRLHDLKVDSLGIPLRGLSFKVSAELPVLEQWERSERLLARLRHEPS